MKTNAFTIGYSGLSIVEFASLLRDHSIETLVDLREIPISRKKGFSKSALKMQLESYGIRYSHFRALGSPMALRHQVREDRDYRTFFAGVNKHLEGKLAVESLQAVQELIEGSRSCLMCFCEDWSHCHRRCVVENLEGRLQIGFTHIRANSQTVAPVLPSMRKAA